MRRFYLNPANYDPNKEECFYFAGDIFRHVFGVCRMSKGARFQVLLGDGKAHLVEVTRVLEKKAFARGLEVSEIAPLPKPHLHLCLAIPKFKTMEAVLEKAVELGVASVTPLFSDYSFVGQKQKNKVEDKYPRWEKIIWGASQQSGRGDLMKLNSVLSLSEKIEELNQSPSLKCLFFYEGLSQIGLKQALQRLEIQGLQSLCLIIGSEGGFSQAEVDKLDALGLDSIGLGSQVLRVETACVSVVSAIKYELGMFR